MTGAAAAQAIAALRREEEEEVTPMSADPTAGFEYKILRSHTGGFRKPERFRQALAEEARAGWELMEKLDDGRLRLRRPVACRERDAELDQDPYRTTVGVSEGALAVRILLAVLGGVLVVVGVLVFALGVK